MRFKFEKLIVWQKAMDLAEGGGRGRLKEIGG